MAYIPPSMIWFRGPYLHIAKHGLSQPPHAHPNECIVVNHGALIVALIVGVERHGPPVPVPGWPLYLDEVIGCAHKGSRSLTQVKGKHVGGRT
eukprot:1160704-Pelagomonas_calceolata.AAC.10